MRAVDVATYQLPELPPPPPPPPPPEKLLPPPLELLAEPGLLRAFSQSLLRK